MHTQIEINRFMTVEDVRAAYGLPESLAGKILAILTVAVVQDDGTRLYLESEVDHVIAEFVSRQRLAEGRANPPVPGKKGRRTTRRRSPCTPTNFAAGVSSGRKYSKRAAVPRLTTSGWTTRSKSRGTWRRYFDNRPRSD